MSQPDHEARGRPPRVQGFLTGRESHTSDGDYGTTSLPSKRPPFGRWRTSKGGLHLGRDERVCWGVIPSFACRPPTSIFFSNIATIRWAPAARVYCSRWNILAGDGQTVHTRVVGGHTFGPDGHARGEAAPRMTTRRRPSQPSAALAVDTPLTLFSRATLYHHSLLFIIARLLIVRSPLRRRGRA